MNDTFESLIIFTFICSYLLNMAAWLPFILQKSSDIESQDYKLRSCNKLNYKHDI